MRVWVGLFLVLLIGCSPANDATLFTKLPSAETGITFQNTLVEDANRNVLLYEYLYNGGGVAAGDFNGDGFDDLFFTGNANPSKLYVNRFRPGEEHFTFEDVTKTAGVAGPAEGWRTGVTVTDLNADGRLDLYVCQSGPFPNQQRAGQLFINQGNDVHGVPRFRDEADAWGLADRGFTTQAAFFDYDRDGDLDCLLLHHNPRRLDNLNEQLIAEMLAQPDTARGIRLMRNDWPNRHFTDVTGPANLRNGYLSYGLGIGVSDVNGDGWPDFYVSSDYLAPDYLYINDQQGGFVDQTSNALTHTAKFSMGNDIADVNNDARPDIMTLDMLPEDNRRQKLLFAPDNYEQFDMNVRIGLHPQYMRNMLQLNAGVRNEQGVNTPSAPHFAEIGQIAGVSNTDWSWSALLADYDNDGWKDLYVTNGYHRDFTNMDFLKYMDNYFQERAGSLRKEDMIGVVQQMPASNVKNYVFRNRGGAQFADAGEAWGLADPTNSNGATYTDLDNDGDLDLVVNNLNAETSVYRNNAERLGGNHALRIRLDGNAPNRLGIGAKVDVFAGGQRQYVEQYLSRGFQSSVSPVLHVGLGGRARADSVRVSWPGGKQQTIRNVSADKPLVLREVNAVNVKLTGSETVAPLLTDVTSPISFTHGENAANDFKRQPLLTNALSYSGPCLAKGDVNGDGLEDVYVGGAAGQVGALFVQQQGGRSGVPAFRESSQPSFTSDGASEDTDALFFDADGDGDQDLYVCSGGYDQFEPDDARLQDRLYVNEGPRGDGLGNFKKALNALPKMPTSTACVRAADLNGDGALDLFVGGRVVPGRYPEPPRSYVLLNNGKGQFRDATATVCPQLARLGMVTDAAFADMNGDQQPDLITAGEWLPIQIWINQNGRLTEQTTAYLPDRYVGWWNKLLVTDLNADGKPDIVAGNQGLNSQCRASAEQPAELVYKDFDNNGTVDPMLCAYIQGETYPFVSRDELMSQLPSRGKRFPDYKTYADARLTDVFSADELAGANRLIATCLETKLFLSARDKRLNDVPLPIEAQYTPVYALLAEDFTGDGKLDLLLGGNATHARLRFGQTNGSYGTLLQNQKNRQFRYVPQERAGLFLTGDVRSFLRINRAVLVGVNGQPVRALTYP